MQFWSVALAGLMSVAFCDAALARSVPGLRFREHPDLEKRALLQNYVTWDEHSLFVKGERIMIFSGEFHPFRLPVPSLWLDIFQKIKALGFNCVSFYSMWALLEGKQGSFTSEGVFDFEPFFDAAMEAGIYLIARPGPYINAEVSFGGYPGWLQRISGHLRTSSSDYLPATDNYVSKISTIIAKYQITNGGPIIFYQVENEYTIGSPLIFGTNGFPDADYMQYIEDQARNASIVIPLINNDAGPLDHNVPGSGTGEVDIYGHDFYPMQFDCSNPSSWNILLFPTYFHTLHQIQSPSTPYTLVEFQAGSYDPWGGSGFNNCAALTGEEFERVYYKNNFAAGVAVLNLYMIYGGTNWGNIGYPSGYTSYDYGAAIAEDGRTLVREKYAELKLEANFLKVSPGYLTAVPELPIIGIYSSNLGVAVTKLEGNETGDFYIVRQTDPSSTSVIDYTLTLPISARSITIPLINLTIPWLPNTITTGSLTLDGRDSKLMVTNYDVHGTNVVYCTADILTHQQFDNQTVLFVYSGSSRERNELALATTTPVKLHGATGVNVTGSGYGQLLSFTTTPGIRSIAQFGNFSVYIMDRNEAYTYWIPELDGFQPSLIVKGPYLVRNASISGNAVHIAADFNITTEVEIIGAPLGITRIVINGVEQSMTPGDLGSLVTTVHISAPGLDIPDLSSLDWKYIDSLPEISADYNDTAWPTAASGELHGSTYGFHAGMLILRGTFTADGTSGTLNLETQGGTAFASSAWLNGSLLGSWTGDSSTASKSQSLSLSELTNGATYTVTVLVDNMGYDENFIVGLDAGKAPRGILSYSLSFGLFKSTTIDWKITGNLGGEDYVDMVRGPLNEGGLYIERQGFHQPNPPVDGGKFNDASPFDGIGSPGVGFFTARFNLSLPSKEWDIPLAFQVPGIGTNTAGAYRAQLWVNGWNFGRYVSNLGPQTRFPVPEGILNYNGENWVGISLWALEAGGASLPEFSLSAGTPVWTGRTEVTLVGSPSWTERLGAY